MTIHDLDETTTRRVLKRICKVMSNLYNSKVTPAYYRDGMVCLVTVDYEIIAFSTPSRVHHTLYFRDAAHLIEMMLMPNTTLHFNLLGKGTVTIDTSKLFGTSFEELCVKLDLMNV